MIGARIAIDNIRKPEMHKTPTCEIKLHNEMETNLNTIFIQSRKLDNGERKDKI